MNRRLRRVVGYIVIPVAFFIIACGIYYVAGAQVKDMMVANIKYVIVKGSPTYSYNEEYEKDSMDNALKGTVEKSEVTVPDQGNQYAVLSNDKFDSMVPVYYGDGKEELENGAGQYVGSYFPGEGKTILIGAHDTTFFSPLEKIEKNDKITIRTSYGTYVYQVKDMEVHDADDNTAYDLSADKEQLILYTCYPFGNIVKDRSQRYFVYCDKIEGPTIKEGPDNE